MTYKIPAERLRELFDYDAASGVVKWRVRKANCIHVGDVVGWEDSNGYLKVTIDGLHYFVHNVIWAWTTGKWPIATVDHENLIKRDNRWLNLREATHSENCENRPVRSDNKTGLKGVTWRADASRWQARIVVNGKRRSLGMFDDKGQAHAAYAAAAMRHHGQFARIV